MPVSSLYYQPELTLPDLLQRAAENDHNIYTGFIDEKGILTLKTYKELLAEANKIATGLSNLGLRQGDKAIIATQHNQEILEFLWGCFLLGVIPTVLQPPLTFSGYNPSVVKLTDVFEQLNKPFIFMSPGAKDAEASIKSMIRSKDDLNFIGAFPKPALKPENVAFIQFSSGSTGDPKGIMLTHKGMIVNLDAIRIGLDIHYPDRIGNWMPLFHDMGLIGYHLTPLYSMTNQYQIDIIDFIMNPGLWLNLVSQEKITISGCTNFGLALVLRFLKRKQTTHNWNFSSMKALLNGAEPISVKIMQDFIDSLSPYEFKPEAMMPVYGMAESTLAISFTPLMKPSMINAFNAILLDRGNKAQLVDPDDPSARFLSEVGIALNDTEIRIVDDNDQQVEEGLAGHIQIRGDGITKGYYNKPDQTTAAFCGDWLRTGDIGFFFNGHLFISGRFKDIIFKNGRNYFANDLEMMACSIEEIDYGKICFCANTDAKKGEDKVIAFLAGVSKQNSEPVFEKLRAKLRSNLGITIDELVLIKSNEIPKTSSGKLQRFKLMHKYLTGEFEDRIIRIPG